MIIVTGGAGFIGSALVWALNRSGEKDILIVDAAASPEKQRNLAPLQYRTLVGKTDFRQAMLAGEYDAAGVTALIHMGACSDTTEKNWADLEDNNVDYSKDVITWCVQHGIRCLYASSAAVYGNGQHGYADDPAFLDRLQPLNLYGRSKLLVDRWAHDAGHLAHVVGLRYFNVFGPNENHKGEMRSMVAKAYAQIQRSGQLKLYKSYRAEYVDGGQQRDFIYVKDAVAATLFFLQHPERNGIYNIGTGTAHTWNELATAIFASLGKPPAIEYIEMPQQIREHYQYFTQADIRALRQAGFQADFTALPGAVTDYLQNYLVPNQHLGEHKITQGNGNEKPPR